MKCICDALEKPLKPPLFPPPPSLGEVILYLDGSPVKTQTVAAGISLSNLDQIHYGMSVFLGDTVSVSTVGLGIHCLECALAHQVRSRKEGRMPL